MHDAMRAGGEGNTVRPGKDGWYAVLVKLKRSSAAHPVEVPIGEAKHEGYRSFAGRVTGGEGVLKMLATLCMRMEMVAGAIGGGEENLLRPCLRFSRTCNVQITSLLL